MENATAPTPLSKTDPSPEQYRSPHGLTLSLLEGKEGNLPTAVYNYVVEELADAVDNIEQLREGRAYSIERFRVKTGSSHQFLVLRTRLVGTEGDLYIRLERVPLEKDSGLLSGRSVQALDTALVTSQRGNLLDPNPNKSELLATSEFEPEEAPTMEQLAVLLRILISLPYSLKERNCWSFAELTMNGMARIQGLQNPPQIVPLIRKSAQWTGTFTNPEGLLPEIMQQFAAAMQIRKNRPHSQSSGISGTLMRSDVDPSGQPVAGPVYEQKAVTVEAFLVALFDRPDEKEMETAALCFLRSFWVFRSTQELWQSVQRLANEQCSPQRLERILTFLRLWLLYDQKNHLRQLVHLLPEFQRLRTAIEYRDELESMELQDLDTDIREYETWQSQAELHSYISNLQISETSKSLETSSTGNAIRKNQAKAPLIAALFTDMQTKEFISMNPVLLNNHLEVQSADDMDLRTSLNRTSKKISKWVQLCMLHPEFAKNVSERAVMYGYIVETAKECVGHGDFASAAALLHGLQSPSVQKICNPADMSKQIDKPKLRQSFSDVEQKLKEFQSKPWDRPLGHFDMILPIIGFRAKHFQSMLAQFPPTEGSGEKLRFRYCRSVSNLVQMQQEEQTKAREGFRALTVIPQGLPELLDRWLSMAEDWQDAEERAIQITVADADVPRKSTTPAHRVG